MLGELLTITSEIRDVLSMDLPNGDIYLQLARAKEQNAMLLSDLEEYE